jgi:hypothetical protein
MPLWSARLCAASARPERADVPRRFMSSDDGGVGTESSRRRRARSRRVALGRAAARGVLGRGGFDRAAAFFDWERAVVDEVARRVLEADDLVEERLVAGFFDVFLEWRAAAGVFRVRLRPEELAVLRFRACRLAIGCPFRTLTVLR